MFEEENGGSAIGNDLESKELGRLLFARRRADLAQAAAVVAFLSAAAGGLLIFSEDLRPYAIASWVLAALLYVSGKYISVMVIRFHECGVVQTKGRRERIICYRDITAFTRSITNYFDRYGRYLGTKFNVAVKTPDAAIQFVEDIYSQDVDLQLLCRHIAEIVADRMLAELQSGRAVPWFGDVTLLPEGLPFPPHDDLRLAHR